MRLLRSAAPALLALSIAGSGEQTRRFVYVEDLAEGVVRALAPVAANRTIVTALSASAST